jgi:hypothetical protein
MRLTTLFAATLLLVISHTAAAGEWLDGDALRQLVSGNTAFCRHVSRPSTGRTYYDEDGTTYGIRRGEHRSGHWYVAGDRLCTNWGEKDYCSRYQEDGKGGHFKYNLAGKKMVHIERWLAGERVDD